METETGVKVTGGVGSSVVVSKIVVVVARSDEEVHTNASEVDHARGPVPITDVSVPMMSYVDGSE